MEKRERVELAKPMPTCECGYTRLLHAGIYGDGPCLVRQAKCKGYREAQQP